MNQKQDRNQPLPDDAVLGNKQPHNSLVLGGLEGCKRRLATAKGKNFLSEVVKAATQYGDEGRALAKAAIREFLLSSDFFEILILMVSKEEEPRQIYLETFKSLSREDRLKLYSTFNPDAVARIQHLVDLGEQARFRDYKNLKVGGRDYLSTFDKEELSQLIENDAVDLIEKEFKEPFQCAAAMRWYLRGLCANRAVQKIKVDREISENAIKSRGKK